MFRKLVTNLSFSPSSIEQLGIFAKKLKDEKILRETGLIFISFSSIALSIVILNPPESSNVISTNHIQIAIQGFSDSLPHFDAELNFAFLVPILILSTLLYFRGRLLSREIREIRRQFNIGAISDHSRRKKSRKSEFTKIMVEIRKKFNPFMKLSSQILHFYPIEVLAGFFANVLMRPISIVVGGLFALSFTSIMFIFAKYYGFTLAGSEWLIAFIFGWMTGTFFDWMREGFGKHPDDII